MASPYNFLLYVHAAALSIKKGNKNKKGEGLKPSPFFIDLYRLVLLQLT